jgi:DNA-binding LacI/PurR family transcriptional regulator
MATKHVMRTPAWAREKVSRRAVAAAAGVSVTTVTHALNPPPGVRMASGTRDHVRRVARELGYRPSFIGRALVSGKSYAIGLLQPAPSSVYSPLYQAIMVGMAGAMEADEYSLLILFRSMKPSYMKVIEQGRVDGMIVLQSDFESASIQRIIATGIPTVVVNRSYTPPAGLPVGCVCSDHDQLMKSAVAEFADLACTSVLAIVDPRTIDANRCMHEAFVREVRRQGKRMRGETMNPAGTDLRAEFRRVFRTGTPWDGIITDGVGFADVLLEEARAAGLAPGRDFHLITSDILDAQMTRTREERAAYTQQPERVGQAAWDMLRGLMRGEETERHIRVAYRRYAGQPQTERITR